MRCLFVPALVCCALVGVSSAAETFKDVGYLYKSEGKDKGHLVDGALVLDTSRVAFQSKTTALDIPIESITNIVCERASKPCYAAGLLFAWPLLFTKSKQHYLTFQYTDGAVGKYAVFRLDKGNFHEILAATEATTSKKIERSEENGLLKGLARKREPRN